MSFVGNYGPWALIAGPTMRTGLTVSNEVAARGLTAIMVARDGDRLEQRAAEIRERRGVEIRALEADLAEPDSGAVLAEATSDLEVGLLANATHESMAVVSRHRLSDT